jgi:hypothetical protein
MGMDTDHRPNIVKKAAITAVPRKVSDFSTLFLALMD